MKSCCSAAPGWFNVVCAILLALFLLNALIRRYWIKGGTEACTCSSESCENLNSNVMVVIVEGMSCNHCRGSVERAIAALPGVESVTVDLASKRAEIVGNVVLSAVKSAVEALGFEVKE